MAAPGSGQIHGGQMSVPGQMQGQMPGPPGMHPQQVPQQALQGMTGMTAMPTNPGNPHQQQVQAQAAVAETDPVAKFKNLLPRLKEALVNLFKVGSHLFYQNASQDETGVQIDNVTGRFEKCLEEFYGICDQIEICLRLAHEIIQQDKDSSRNTPTPVLPQKTDAPQPDGHLYSQYLSTVRAQISCAKDIRDLLHECLKNFPEHSHS